MLYNSKKYASKYSKIPSEIESEAGMAEVVNCVKKTNADKEMRARMEDRENSLMAFSIMRGNSYQKGKEDGQKDKIKEIVNNMLLNGISKENILKLTGISQEDFNNANLK